MHEAVYQHVLLKNSTYLICKVVAKFELLNEIKLFDKCSISTQKCSRELGANQQSGIVQYNHILCSPVLPDLARETSNQGCVS